MLYKERCTDRYSHVIDTTMVEGSIGIIDLQTHKNQTKHARLDNLGRCIQTDVDCVRHGEGISSTLGVI